MAALTRRELIGGAGALAGGLLLGRAHAAPSTDQDLIVLTTLGGWDVSYALDPKLGSPWVDGPDLDEDPDQADDVEAVTTFAGLDVLTNGVKRPAVGTFFERWAPHAVIVRGIWVGSISHDACRVRILTGAAQATQPDLAAMVGAARADSAPLPYVDLAGAGYVGELAAITGQAGRNRQLRFLLDRSLALRRPDGGRYPLYQAHPDDQAAMQAWLDAQASAQADAWAGRPGAVHRLDDAASAGERAAALRTEGKGLAASLGRLAGAQLPGRLDLAVDLLQGGLARTVLVDSGANWDTHDDNRDQHGLHDDLFAGLDHLMQRLTDDGRLARTTVVVLSEMTRTPKRNETGGKDHWPVTSALVLGGRAAGGRVLGASTASLDAAPIDLVTGLPDPRGAALRYDQFTAGLLAMLDADPARWLPGVTPLGGLTG